MKKTLTTIVLTILCLSLSAESVKVIISKKATNRERYAAEYLQKKLTALGYTISQKKSNYME